MSDQAHKSAPAIQVQDVTKRYVSQGDEVIAVKNLNLEVEPGELVAFLGPSGSGKTTLLRLIAGFEKPDSGSISLYGRSVVDVSRDTYINPEVRNVGMIFQDYALFPHLDVSANVAFGIGDSEDGRRRVMEVLDLVGLTGMERRYPHQHRVLRGFAEEPESVPVCDIFFDLLG